MLAESTGCQPTLGDEKFFFGPGATRGTEQGSTAAPGFSFSGLTLTLLDERKTEIFCLVASTQLEETPGI